MPRGTQWGWMKLFEVMGIHGSWRNKWAGNITSPLCSDNKCREMVMATQQRSAECRSKWTDSEADSEEGQDVVSNPWSIYVHNDQELMRICQTVSWLKSLEVSLGEYGQLGTNWGLTSAALLVAASRLKQLTHAEFQVPTEFVSAGKRILLSKNDRFKCGHKRNGFKKKKIYCWSLCHVPYPWRWASVSTKNKNHLTNPERWRQTPPVDPRVAAPAVTS